MVQTATVQTSKIEQLASEVRRESGAPVTYFSRTYEPGERIMLPQSVLFAFDEPGDVTINNLGYQPGKMFVAHYAQMWLEPKARAKVGYVVPGRVKIPDAEKLRFRKINNDASSAAYELEIMPSRIYVSADEGEGLEAVLTSTRQDPVADVLKGKKYMLKTRSPQLAYLDGLKVVNYNESPMGVRGTMVITPHNIVREHTKAISLPMAGTEVSYL